MHVAGRTLFLSLMSLALLAPGFACLESTGSAKAASPEELIDLWRNVDAVVHLKIEKNAGIRVTSAIGCSRFYEHEARVLELFRPHFGGPKITAALLQPAAPCNMVLGSFPAFRLEDEFVAFLRWNVAEKAFLGYLMVPVRNGEVKSPYLKEIENGMKLDAFLTKLRAMME